MSIRRKIATSAIALGVLGGAGLAVAPAAQAGTSIGATYNGASHVYYKFYASTNTFCIKQKGKKNTAAVDLYPSGKSSYGIQTAANNKWGCEKLTSKYGFKEGNKVRFKLWMYRNSDFKKVHRDSAGFIRL